MFLWQKSIRRMLSFAISELISNVQWNDIMLIFKTSDNIVLQNSM